MQNKEILKEIGCYIGCLLFIAAFVCYSGFFSADSKGVSETFVDYVKSSGIEAVLEQNTSSRQSASSYKTYRPRFIPKAVIEGSKKTYAWGNIFASDKKVVFYLYDNNDKFHNEISSFISKNSLYSSYKVEAYNEANFKSMQSGNYGSTKICNSIEECNAVRQNASAYSTLTNFLSVCGKTMCIFDMRKNQYLQLKNRDYKQAGKMLIDLKNW